MIEIGAFEAKNHFSCLLERARKGDEFTIAVARLDPAHDENDTAKTRTVLNSLCNRARQQDKPVQPALMDIVIFG